MALAVEVYTSDRISENTDSTVTTERDRNRRSVIDRLGSVAIGIGRRMGSRKALALEAVALCLLAVACKPESEDYTKLGDALSPYGYVNTQIVASASTNDGSEVLIWTGGGTNGEATAVEGDDDDGTVTIVQGTADTCDVPGPLQGFSSLSSGQQVDVLQAPETSTAMALAAKSSGDFTFRYDGQKWSCQISLGLTS